MKKGERQNVYKVYDRIADWFAANRSAGTQEQKYLDRLISRLPAEAVILDVGCGTGIPVITYLLSKNLKVTGVDASEAILKHAKKNFPSTEFILQDMRKLELPQKFDAIVAWHSLWHLPAAEHPAMFQVFKQHLNDQGLLLFTSGTEYGEAWGVNGGENLFHSSLATADYEQHLANNNFTVLSHDVNDPDCGGATVWLAQYAPEA